MMTMGRGAAINLSRKQKTNARSSTEAELIGVYDALPSILHAKYFIEAMGYGIANNIMYQDNKSSITLERNGKASGSKRSKHIKIRYFFIKDVIDQGEVEIQHCPTTEMWSDVLTKPKQGKEFLLMRSKLLGHDIADAESLVTLRTPALRSPQGCVGQELPRRKIQDTNELRVEVNRGSRGRRVIEHGKHARVDAYLRAVSRPAAVCE
jgi:hypothetical protein